jgi:Sulfotransferase family
MSARGAVAAWLSRLPGNLQRILPYELRADLRRRLGRFRPWEEGYDFTPPAPDGLPATPPDFIGVGASLCATGWWYDLICAHPRVAERRGCPIGLHYFSHYCLRAFDDADAARYRRWFARPPGTVAGEWTTSYAAQPWVAPLLVEAAPEARLLFLVRDPVERFRLDMARIVESRVANVGASVADVIDRGFYAVQLRRLHEFVPAERILVLQLEHCLADVDGQLGATYRFLGLDDGFRPPRRVAGPRADVPPLESAVAERLSEMYAQDIRDLATLVPDLDLDRWPAFLNTS